MWFDEFGVVCVVIESFVESFCDGIVVLLFWLVVFGFFGFWVYKVINIVDSLIGYCEECWCVFGWVFVWIDDVVNWILVWLSGVVLCFVGFGGWWIMICDVCKYVFFNVGWFEVVMVGVFGIRLVGLIVYDGVMLFKFWIGIGCV